MTLQDVYFVAEIIGVVAVVGSLLFVGVQMRLTRLASAAQGTIVTSEIYSRWRLAILNSPDLAAIVDRANTGQELSGVDRIKMAAMADELFVSASVSYSSGTQTGLVHEQQAEIDYLTDILDDNPGIIHAWHKSKHIANGVSTQFVDAIDAYLAKTEVS
jgi:hypothetical protein